MSEEKTECGCVDSCLHKPNCVFETPATREIATLRAELASARKALVVAEDILSRAPFSTGILPNGMHPQTVISQIREAISLTSAYRKEE
jgi:hypothetical protein